MNVVAPQINDLWVYLSTTPLLGLTVTLLAYQAAWERGEVILRWGWVWTV